MAPPSYRSIHQWIDLQRLMTLAGGTVSFGSRQPVCGGGAVGYRYRHAAVPMAHEPGRRPRAGAYREFLRRRGGELLAQLEMVVPASATQTIRDGAHFGRFLTVGLFALLMRGGVLALLVYGWHVSPMLAIFPAVAVTAAIHYLGTAFYVFPVRRTFLRRMCAGG